MAELAHDASSVGVMVSSGWLVSLLKTGKGYVGYRFETWLGKCTHFCLGHSKSITCFSSPSVFRPYQFFSYADLY